MSTIRQIEANRRNSRNSTGPRSAQGKAVSSMNALKSGINAKALVLPNEKLADLQQLIAEYTERHRPASPEARLYVDELIHSEWMLRRLRAAETQMWQYQNHNPYAKCDPEKFPLGKAATAHPNTFSRLQYRLDATRRAYNRALQVLKDLPAAPVTPSPEATSPQIGFVPSSPSAAALPAPLLQPVSRDTCVSDTGLCCGEDSRRRLEETKPCKDAIC